MKKILIVDDKVEVRDLLEVTLRVDDYEILQAVNGEEALFLTRTARPDLVIMDVMMPGKTDGLEATRIIKNDPNLAQTKIILLTARGQALDKAKGFDAGADEYFAKPFSPLELIRKVEEVLDQVS